MARFRLLVIGLLMMVLVTAVTLVRAGNAVPLMADLVTADFGDAPDDATGVSFFAYPDVPAHYPTLITKSSIGPRHDNSVLAFYLGDGISGEENADSGLDMDVDGNNLVITGTLAFADQDGYDDGLMLPDQFVHCQETTLQFTVTVTDSFSAAITGYANLWLDWNRDGDWGDITPACPGQSVGVNEWAMQNMPMTLTGPGTYTFTTPPFMTWNEQPDQAMWIRLSVAEEMATAVTGAGPLSGYLYGETEDYRWPGSRYLSYLPVIIGDGIGIPPVDDDDTHVDESVPNDVQIGWSQIPADDTSAILDLDNVNMVITNNGETPQQVEILINLLGNGDKSVYRTAPFEVAPGSSHTEPLPTTLLLPAVQAFRSPVLLQGEARVADPVSIQAGSDTHYVAEIGLIAFHPNEDDPNQIVAYNELGLQRQMSAMQFDHNAALGSRMAELIPAADPPSNLTNFTLYSEADSVINENSEDPGTSDDFPPPQQQPDNANLDAPASPDLFTFTLCLEWYTAPIDNGFGEDYGLNDSGWRARGAKVRVWQQGNKIFDGYMNRYGCTYVSTSSTAGIYIYWPGEVRLESGNGYITVRHLSVYSNDTGDLATSSAWIDHVSSNQVYRPEIWNFDSLGMLSYAAQERFNGGVSGVTYYLKKAGCNNDSSQGSCATSIFGKPGIYMSSGQYRRKFILGHEYGHRILASAADYKNDCSYNGSGHGMKGLEYGSCAAMEGWGHFVSVAIWNAHSHSNTNQSNPDGIIVYWDGKDTVYSAETGSDQAYCWQRYPGNFRYLCDNYGYELDWMRQWWDYHTNPGNRPSHADMFELIDDTVWQNGFFFSPSDAVRDALGNNDGRWRSFDCWNGVYSTGCN